MNRWLRLARIPNVAVSAVGTIVGGWAARGSGFQLPGNADLLLLLAAASTALVTAGGNALNDLLDRDGDRANHPDRPLVTGEIGPESARRFVGVAFAAGVAVAIPVIWAAPRVIVLLALALAAILSYEFRFKAVGVLGNLEVAFLTGLVFLYGAASVGPIWPVAALAGMAFLATLSREVIKDMEDMTGDVGRSTLPRRHGLGRSTGVARAAIVGAVALSALPFFGLVRWGSPAGIMYLALVLAADAIFVVSVAGLPRRLHWSQTVSKIAMAVALVAFLAVAFR
ncbi:MAG: UbiA family prenyltransferase [Thermoplasmata archaeon]